MSWEECAENGIVARSFEVNWTRRTNFHKNVALTLKELSSPRKELLTGMIFKLDDAQKEYLSS